MHRQADLLEVVGALRPAGRLTRRLNRREQQGDQHGDDGDDDQKLDQSKRAGSSRRLVHDPVPSRNAKSRSSERGRRLRKTYEMKDRRPSGRNGDDNTTPGIVRSCRTTIPAFDPVPRPVTARSGPGHSAAPSEHDVRIASAVNDGGAVNRSRLPPPGRTQGTPSVAGRSSLVFRSKTATSNRSRARPAGWGDPHIPASRAATAPEPSGRFARQARPEYPRHRSRDRRQHAMHEPLSCQSSGEPSIRSMSSRTIESTHRPLAREFYKKSKIADVDHEPSVTGGRGQSIGEPLKWTGPHIHAPAGAAVDSTSNAITRSYHQLGWGDRGRGSEIRGRGGGIGTCGRSGVRAGGLSRGGAVLQMRRGSAGSRRRAGRG